KVLTADCYGHDEDIFELNILKHIRAQTDPHPGAKHIPGLLNHFRHHGPNGEHVCLVFKAMGPNLSRYRRLFPKLRIPLPLVKEISRQLLLALSYLHGTCRIIHTGYFNPLAPQNILVETPAINEVFEQTSPSELRMDDSSLEPPYDFYMDSALISAAGEDLASTTSLSVRLADFGTSSWFDNHLTERIQPQMLRAPEVTLGADWDFKVDIWNLGVVIWELAEGALLFNGTWTPNAPYAPEAHLAQMTAVLGDMPRSLLARSKNRADWFDADGLPWIAADFVQGKLFQPSTFGSCSLEQFSRNPNLSGPGKKAFLSFIRSMIRLGPDERLDARTLLKSEWLN
ncbi:kinase-like domain-containing protein, partial [Diplogelasinospora grovesii]